jgi:hypothetical protein
MNFALFWKVKCLVSFLFMLLRKALRNITCGLFNYLKTSCLYRINAEEKSVGFCVLCAILTGSSPWITGARLNLDRIIILHEGETIEIPDRKFVACGMNKSVLSFVIICYGTTVHNRSMFESHRWSTYMSPVIVIYVPYHRAGHWVNGLRQVEWRRTERHGLAEWTLGLFTHAFREQGRRYCWMDNNWFSLRNDYWI